MVINCQISINHTHSFEWVTYRTRDLTQKNYEQFHSEYRNVDWQKEIGGMDCPSQMTAKLHEITMRITNSCLPWRTRKIRSTDDPWITDEIRRAIQKRMRRYKKAKRSVRWKEAKEESDKLLKEAKIEYYNKAVDKLKQQGGNIIPYKILKEIAVINRPKPWTIQSIRPGVPDEVLVEELADFFTKITDEFTLIEGYCPPFTFSSPFKQVLPHEVAQRIRESKKPKSAVEGDILPGISNKYSNITAIPATRIINFALHKLVWPEPWLIETQNAIPKNESACNFDQLRNLSSTNALSKLLESLVLEQLRREITIKHDQFGAIPGSGTNHFLIECWDKILRVLDTPEMAVSMLSIDFSKAFNRMDHRLCFEALAECGASSESLMMITSFLSGRRMRFKMNGTLSTTRGVNGGSPQGTRLGNFLFIVSINRIEEGQDFTPPPK